MAAWSPCARCGYRRLRLRRSTCLVCGAAVCEHCELAFGFTQSFAYKAPPGSTGRYEPLPPSYQTVCSWQCYDRWAWGFIARGQAPTASGPSYALGDVYLQEAPAQRALAMAEEHRRNLRMEQARNLIEAEDHEAAARVFQELGMWKEAGELRRKTRQPQVVTQVLVNMNDLIEQLRRMGLSANYTCPACRSPNTITGETPPDKPLKCQYCGTIVPLPDLVEAVAKVVGYR